MKYRLSSIILSCNFNKNSPLLLLFIVAVGGKTRWEKKIIMQAMLLSSMLSLTWDSAALPLAPAAPRLGVGEAGWLAGRGYWVAHSIYQHGAAVIYVPISRSLSPQLTSAGKPPLSIRAQQGFSWHFFPPFFLSFILVPHHKCWPPLSTHADTNSCYFFSYAVLLLCVVL